MRSNAQISKLFPMRSNAQPLETEYRPYRLFPLINITVCSCLCEGIMGLISYHLTLKLTEHLEEI